MTIKLQGNVAREATIEIGDDNEFVKFRGNAVCCNDLFEIPGVVEKMHKDGNDVIILRNQSDVDLDHFQSQYSELTKLFDPEKEYLVISNNKLPEKKGVYAIYVPTPDLSDEEPFFLVRDGDNLLLNLKEGVLYMYVADVELTQRKYEWMKQKETAHKR